MMTCNDYEDLSGHYASPSPNVGMCFTALEMGVLCSSLMMEAYSPTTEFSPILESYNYINIYTTKLPLKLFQGFPNSDIFFCIKVSILASMCVTFMEIWLLFSLYNNRPALPFYCSLVPYSPMALGSVSHLSSPGTFLPLSVKTPHC